MPTKTQAIALFLKGKTHPDLANLYSDEMEVQVNVAQDDGEPIEGEYKGRKWRGYTNGLETWKPLRIPWNANSKPEYTDSDMTWNLEAHVEAIGMTGWNWKLKASRWIAFDFDSLINHKQGLTQVELESVVQALKGIEWVTIRKSTSGTGLHIYVYIPGSETVNHNEHAALARALLGKLSAMTAFDLRAKVDACGGNMWVWHRKMKGTDGLTVIKAGRPILESEIPSNWKDHTKVLHQRKAPTDKTSSMEQLASQRSHVNLDAEHKRLIEFLETSGALWWWDADLNMLVTHTYWLKKAHADLGLKGTFETASKATNTKEQNCFCFPSKGGSWSVRRYTPGVQEHSTWDVDAGGWTRCYLNREADLQTASRAYGALENKKGAMVFSEAEMGVQALTMLGINVEVPPALRTHKMTIIPDKKDDRKLLVEIDKKDGDVPPDGWTPEKSTWFKAFTMKAVPTSGETDLADFDDFLRHLVTNAGDDYGWAVLSDNQWRFEPLVHVYSALTAMGYGKDEVKLVVGTAVLRPWKKVNLPLQPEYPGRREWNIGSAQLAFAPSDSENLHYPTWTKVLKHCGSGLDDALQHNAWAKANGLKTGADYLKCWIAALLQHPTEPLPYLFFYGDQDCGKSTFHESISLLLTRGVRRADAALISQSNFNAELEDAILCVVEETELQANKQAYNRIKDWVTGREILIHKKGMTPYHTTNTTHWCQMANERAACPIFPGDTRITMCWVPNLTPIEKIPKNDLFDQLKKEAPDFLAEVLKLEIPRSNDRLTVPVILTSDKMSATEDNMTSLELFLHQQCHYIPGKVIKYAEFYNKFKECCDPSEIINWSMIKVGRNLPPQFPKGRLTSDHAQWYIGNISFGPPDEGEPILAKLVLVGDKLVSQMEGPK